LDAAFNSFNFCFVLIAAIKYGFGHALKYWKIGVFIFLIQLIFGLLVGFELDVILSKYLLHSKAGEVLNHGFDYTIAKDITTWFPYEVSNLNSKIFVSLLVYVIISVFLNAGILGCLSHKENSWKSFFKKGIKYFIPFFFIAILTLVLVLLVSALIWMPIGSKWTVIIEAIESDRLFFYLLCFCGFIYLLLISLILSWSINIRVSIIRKLPFFRSLRSSFKFSFKYLLKYFMSLVWFIILGLIFIYAQRGIEELLNSPSALIVLILFIASFFILSARIIARIWLYASYLNFYDKGLGRNLVSSDHKV